MSEQSGGLDHFAYSKLKKNGATPSKKQQMQVLTQMLANSGSRQSLKLPQSPFEIAKGLDQSIDSIKNQELFQFEAREQPR